MTAGETVRFSYMLSIFESVCAAFEVPPPAMLVERWKRSSMQVNRAKSAFVALCFEQPEHLRPTMEMMSGFLDRHESSVVVIERRGREHAAGERWFRTRMEVARQGAARRRALYDEAVKRG